MAEKSDTEGECWVSVLGLHTVMFCPEFRRASGCEQLTQRSPCFTATRSPTRRKLASLDERYHRAPATLARGPPRACWVES